MGIKIDKALLETIVKWLADTFPNKEGYSIKTELTVGANKSSLIKVDMIVIKDEKILMLVEIVPSVGIVDLKYQSLTRKYLHIVRGASIFITDGIWGYLYHYSPFAKNPSKGKYIWKKDNCYKL